MLRFRSKSYRYPRWPLVKNTMECAGGMLVGAGILFAPIGHGRWLGLLPIAYCGYQWHFRLQPKWSFVVRMDHEKLQVGSTVYPWSSFDQFHIGQNGESKRYLHLTGRNGLLDIEIKDDLPGFDELAHACFFHVNRIDESDEKRGANGSIQAPGTGKRSHGTGR